MHTVLSVFNADGHDDEVSGEAASKEEEEDKKRLKQVNNACSLFLNRPGQLPPG